MKVGIFQFNPERNNKIANLNKISKNIKSVDADIIVLPELCLSGYYFSDRNDIIDLSDEYGYGDTFELFSELAKQNNNYLIFGYAEKYGDKLYNSAAIVGPKGPIGNYRKTHLFYKEKLIFDVGDTGFNVFSIGNDIKAGIMICYDWFFPESARTLMLKGANLICHPSNLVLPYCQKAMFARAVENRVFTVTANRIGCEKADDEVLEFSGNSIIYNPKGDILLQTKKDNECIDAVDIDITEANNKNITSLNNLLDDRNRVFYQL